MNPRRKPGIDDVALRITRHESNSRSGMNSEEQLDAYLAAVAPLYKERDKTYSEIKKLLNPYGVCGLSIKELEQQEKKYVKSTSKTRSYRSCLHRSWMPIIHSHICSIRNCM